MEHCTKKADDGKEIPRFGRDSIEQAMRQRIRDTIEELVKEELDAALGASKSARVGEQRQGYRHGTRERTLTTSVGPATFAMPRARIQRADGRRTEWRSETVRRYERRTTRVDEAILGVYLAGGNTRRIKGALAPLLKDGPLSKDAVSRLVGRLREDFETWCSRDLAEEDIRYVFMDGWYPKVRIGGRRERVPVLVTLGVRGNGERIVLDLRLVGEESAASWTEVVASLTARQLARPVLAIIDGNAGLRRAVGLVWPKSLVQRCCVHKLRNLERKAEIRDDFHRVVYAANADAARAAYAAFERAWGKRCPGVVTSIREGGDELLTFFAFPKAQWKTLRTTNTIERLHEQFRRRVKTQGSLPGEEAALSLLFGLVASGQLKLRRIDGWRRISQHTVAAA